MGNANSGIHTLYEVRTNSHVRKYPSYHDAVIKSTVEHGPFEWMSIRELTVSVPPKVGTSRALMCDLLNDGPNFISRNTLFYCEDYNAMTYLYLICESFNEGILLPDMFASKWFTWSTSKSYLYSDDNDALDVWRWSNDVTSDGSEQQYYIVNAVTYNGILLHGRVGSSTMQGRFKQYQNPWTAIKEWLQYHNEDV